MADRNDRDVKLSIIDKEHQSLVAAGRAVEHALFWEIVASALALALCLRWIEIGPQLSFAGMTISVPQTDFMLGLAIVVTVLFWRAGSLDAYGERLRRHIAEVYDSLGYSDHTDSTGFSAFMYPDFLAVLGALDDKWRRYLARFFQGLPQKNAVPARVLFVDLLLVPLCWIVTYFVTTTLDVLLLLLPLIVDGFSATFTWQHREGGPVTAAIILVLVLVYVAGLWMSGQAADWQNAKRMRSELRAKVLTGISQYLQAAKPTGTTAPTSEDQGAVQGSASDAQTAPLEQ